MPKRVDCIGFNDPLLILPKNERNAKIPNTQRICVFPYMSVFLIILYSKHIPPYPTILLKNLFNRKGLVELDKVTRELLVDTKEVKHTGHNQESYL